MGCLLGLGFVGGFVGCLLGLVFVGGFVGCLLGLLARVRAGLLVGLMRRVPYPYFLRLAIGQGREREPSQNPQL